MGVCINGDGAIPIAFERDLFTGVGRFKGKFECGK
jgi:hypothetical protein